MSCDYTALPRGNPPSYEPEQDQQPRQFGDNIPDDFKYSVDVASCELPLRHLFLRKVYALLSVQVLGTVMVGYLIRSNSSVQAWCFNNMWLFFVSLVGSIGFLIGSFFKARSYPVNLYLLAGFTLCEAYMVGLATAFVETGIVVEALLLTFIIFIGLTLFAFQTKYDFTQWQGIVGIGLWTLIGWGFVMMFFPGHSKGMDLVYSGFGALLFCVYVLIDTQRIMKTAHLDDEVIATITLYLDLLNLFLYILRILQNRND